MNHNAVIITPCPRAAPAPPAPGRAAPALGSKQAIIGRPALDLAWALCARDASLLALGVYATLQVEPPPKA